MTAELSMSRSSSSSFASSALVARNRGLLFRPKTSKSALATKSESGRDVYDRMNDTRDISRVSNERKEGEDLAVPEALFGAISMTIMSTIETVSGVQVFLDKVMTSKPLNFPPGPENDCAVELGQDPLKFLERVNKRYGSIAGFKLAGELVVLVSARELAKEVLVDSESDYTKKGTAFFPSSRLAGEGLLVTDGDVWKSQRRLSNPAFRKAAVETYASSMNECIAEALSTRWSSGNMERDLYEDFNEITLQVVCRTLFGDDALGAKGKEIVDSIRVAFEYFAKRSTGIEMIIPEWLPIPTNVMFNDAVDKLDKAVYGIIDKRMEMMEEPCFIACNIQEMDLLDRLLSASLDDLDESETLPNYNSTSRRSRKMNRKQLRDEVMTLIVAGQETSAIVLSWAAAFVAQNGTEFGERIAKETRAARIIAGKKMKKKEEEEEKEKVKMTLGSSNNIKNDNESEFELTFDSIKHLPFTEAIILETMRLKPPAYIVGRSNSMNDVKLNGFEIPRGSTILISPYLAQRDGRFWSKPTEFDPNRWLEIDPETSEPYARNALKGMGTSGTYFPFGAGPRVCIGAQFAMLEAILLLAQTFEKRELSFNNNNNNNSASTYSSFPKDNAGITLRPNEVRLFVKPRRRVV